MKLVHESNVTADMNLQKLLQVTKDQVLHVTKDDCQGHCTHIENTEKEYWERDKSCSRCKKQHYCTAESDIDSDGECDKR
jgi:hypothetical protein